MTSWKRFLLKASLSIVLGALFGIGLAFLSKDGQHGLVAFFGASVCGSLLTVIFEPYS